MSEHGGALWGELLAAERLVARLRAEIARTEARFGMLAAALDLNAGSWEQGAALNYLASFRQDIARLTPALFALAMGGRWEGRAREVLAMGSRADVAELVSRLAIEYFPRPDPEAYLQVAALLADVEAEQALKAICSEAVRSDDPEIREAGEFISDRYRVLMVNDSD